MKVINSYRFLDVKPIIAIPFKVISPTLYLIFNQSDLTSINPICHYSCWRRTPISIVIFVFLIHNLKSFWGMLVCPHWYIFQCLEEKTIFRVPSINALLVEGKWALHNKSNTSFVLSNFFLYPHKKTSKKQVNSIILISFDVDNDTAKPGLHALNQAVLRVLLAAKNST